jgi:hypothetical protein
VVQPTDKPATLFLSIGASRTYDEEQGKKENQQSCCLHHIKVIIIRLQASKDGQRDESEERKKNTNVDF